VTTDEGTQRASTAHAVSPDSGLPWAQEGAWPVAEGLWRIPLPLPGDVLKAVNVYVAEAESGIVLVDGGWAVTEARGALERSLASIGYGVRDIGHFLVTHAHRDHYTMASVLAREIGATSSLGIAERPALDLENQYRDPAAQATVRGHIVAGLLAVGAPELIEEILRSEDSETNPQGWDYPTRWLTEDETVRLGDRTVEAIHTPGHTPGHYVFADRENALLFAGDHVLPTITPSIGYTLPLPDSPLSDFLASLAKVRALPDLRLLPAHGPITESTHTRIDELLEFHEQRLTDSLAGVAAGGSSAAHVARTLPWTRRHRTYEELGLWDKELAAYETRAHLEVLVARNQLTRTLEEATFVYRHVPSSPST
jgi:glyoxylase-like metal-dependent hydrolase (beta-lactamase superfamily II)